jgi:hypothetical protein
VAVVSTAGYSNHAILIAEFQRKAYVTKEVSIKELMLGGCE